MEDGLILNKLPR